MTLLEIMVDVFTWYDLQEEGNYFDAGTFAGKGLVNACFTLYYLVIDYFLPKPEEEDVDGTAL